MTLDTFLLAAASGVLATYCLIVVALWAPRFHCPQVDFSKAMANLYWGETLEGEPPYWAAFAAIHVNGIIFALVYATEVGQHLPGPGVVAGLIWGGILYLGAELIFVPIFLKGGIFSVKAHPMAWLTSLIVHAIWGAVVGWLCPIIV